MLVCAIVYACVYVCICVFVCECVRERVRLCACVFVFACAPASRVPKPLPFSRARAALLLPARTHRSS